MTQLTMMNKEFKDKINRLAVLVSQAQANKLVNLEPEREFDQVRSEISEILSPMHFTQKRMIYKSLQADVEDTVRRNLEMRDKRKKRRR